MSAGETLPIVAVLAVLGWLAFGVALAIGSRRWWRSILAGVMCLIGAGLWLLAAAGLVTFLFTPGDPSPNPPCEDCPHWGNPGG